jgi:hypothetical protein
MSRAKSEASFDLIERVNNNETKVLRDHKGHQNPSQAILAVAGWALYEANPLEQIPTL